MMKFFLTLLLLTSLLNVSISTPEVCKTLNCKADESCDWEIEQCVNKNDMTEGRPCEKHEDCRDDHICYVAHCIFFIGRH